MVKRQHNALSRCVCVGGGFTTISSYKMSRNRCNRKGIRKNTHSLKFERGTNKQNKIWKGNISWNLKTDYIPIYKDIIFLNATSYQNIYFQCNLLKIYLDPFLTWEVKSKLIWKSTCKPEETQFWKKKSHISYQNILPNDNNSSSLLLIQI